MSACALALALQGLAGSPTHARTLATEAAKVDVSMARRDPIRTVKLNLVHLRGDQLQYSFLVLVGVGVGVGVGFSCLLVYFLVWDAQRKFVYQSSSKERENFY